MNNFMYNAPTRVYFGRGEEKRTGEIIKSYGFKKIMLHYGKSSIKRTGLYDVIVKSLNDSGIEFVDFGGVEPNPKLSLCLKGVEIAKKENVELILAVGGGSVLDSAKLIAVGACVDFNPWKFSIKEAAPTKHIPVGSVLTISAAGSEMSNSCVITNDETLEKRGFTSEENRCLFAIMNPELTFTLPKYQTACGVVDIMMHTLERYFSLGDATPITDNIALGLLKAVKEAGEVLMTDPNNYNARANIMWANSLSHNGLTSCGRSFFMAVHQLEHELSGMYDRIAHGAGLAALWPSWAKYSYHMCKERFSEYAYYVFNVDRSTPVDEAAIKGIELTRDFFKSLGMPTSLKELEVEESRLEELAYNAMFKGKRTLPDIVELDYERALEVYRLAYNA